MQMLQMLTHSVPVTGLLDHTTKWLAQAVADLTTLPPTCPDTPDSSSVSCTSLNEAANSPEPLSPAMVLSQGFLNLLLWDPENEEFPEVGLCGALPCCFVFRTSTRTLLLTACPSLLPQTVLMDRTRLQELESQLHQLTILASVLLVASSFSGSVLFGSPQFVDKLKRITKALMEEFNSK